MYYSWSRKRKNWTTHSTERTEWLEIINKFRLIDKVLNYSLPLIFLRIFSGAFPLSCIHGTRIKCILKQNWWSGVMNIYELELPKIDNWKSLLIFSCRTFSSYHFAIFVFIAQNVGSIQWITKKVQFQSFCWEKLFISQENSTFLRFILTKICLFF